MSMEEVRWKAVFPGIEVSSSTLQCKFPPFSAKSVHPSVNLPACAQDAGDAGPKLVSRVGKLFRIAHPFLSQRVLSRGMVVPKVRLFQSIIALGFQKNSPRRPPP